MNHVVLVHPAIPQNTGNIMRTCAATHTPLHIIKPTGFKLNDPRMKRAVMDYFDHLTFKVYENFEEFEKENPGIYSSRFMGEDTSYDIKNQWIIDAVKDKEDKTARFVCAMALAIPDEETKTFLGTFEGEINDCIDGENGFGYDPIFYYPPLKKTSAVMTMEEKNKVSHRAKALKALYDYLEEAHK